MRPQRLGLLLPQQPAMHHHTAHVIDRHHGPAQRQHVRRVEGQALLDGLQVIAYPVDFLMQCLHVFIGQIGILIIEPALQFVLLGFQLGDALGLGLVRVAARAAGTLECVQFRMGGTRCHLHPAPAFHSNGICHGGKLVARKGIQQR